MKQKVEAYLNFDGDAKEALEYYKEIFEVTESQTMKWGDMPADEANEVSDSMDPDALLYGDLTIGSSNLMINDQPGTLIYQISFSPFSNTNSHPVYIPNGEHFTSCLVNAIDFSQLMPSKRINKTYFQNID